MTEFQVGRKVMVSILSAMVLLTPAASSPSWGADPVDRKNDHIARGAEIYREHCASCHGARLEGQPNWRERKPDGRLPAPPHDETGHTWHHPDRHLFRITKLGLTPPLAPDGYESDMPAFEDTLTDEQIRSVLDYIKSLWPPRIRARQRRISETVRDER